MKDYQEAVIKTVEKVLPAVVSIAVVQDAQRLGEQLFTESFRMGRPIHPDDIQSKLEEAPQDEKGRIKLGGGSGFFVSPNGVVLTNKHVISDPTMTYTVITAAGQKYDARILARDQINDIAVLKIEADKTDLPTVELGVSKNLKLGQSVIAIGNALGEFQNTISTGIISGLSRLISAVADMSGRQERLRGLIQTDAAINPGNSGGPLVNLDGQAIGINTAVVFGAQNISFAIPIERAKKDLAEIKTHGRIRMPFLGIRYMILNKNLQKQFGFPLDHGAMIVNENLPGDCAVIPGSASDKAGLRELDVILACNKKKITETETLEDILAGCSVGDKLDLEILRNQQKINAQIVLEEMPIN